LAVAGAGDGDSGSAGTLAFADVRRAIATSQTA
jgi:hypothetical protein